MAGVRAAKGKAPVLDGNVVIFEHFAGLDIHPFSASDNHVSGCAPCRNSDQIGGAFGPCFESCVFHLPIVMSFADDASPENTLQICGSASMV